MTTTAQNILKTLGYFDLFQYPLTKEEIYLFHSNSISFAAIDEAVEMLLSNNIIFRIDDFYSLHNDKALAQRRCQGNFLANRQMKIAHKAAKLLSAFPYVKGVAVSGSLSKKFADKNSDIDFFIITTANRLWIARSFMHLYKKFTFLTGRQHWFCMNYYVDEAQMEIEEKNIFTAMEIITLIPMQGNNMFTDFFKENDWTKIFFPILNPQVNKNSEEIKPAKFKKIIEYLFSGSMGDKLDKWLMGVTNKRWQRKAAKQQLNSKGRNIGMVVGPHFSKPDPKNFQQKILQQYDNKLQQLLQQPNKTVCVLL